MARAELNAVDVTRMSCVSLGNDLEPKLLSQLLWIDLDHIESVVSSSSGNKLVLPRDRVNRPNVMARNYAQALELVFVVHLFKLVSVHFPDGPRLVLRTGAEVLARGTEVDLPNCGKVPIHGELADPVVCRVFIGPALDAVVVTGREE